MPDPIIIPPIVGHTVRAALAERDARGGLHGMTRTAALTAAELAAAPVTTSDVVASVASWHAANPQATSADGRSTLLAGVWGGRAGRDWAFAMSGGARPAALQAEGPNTGVMVALYPDPETAAALAIGYEAPEELHVTLGYPGQMDELAPEALAAAAQALGQVAKRFPPITGVVAGLARFNGAAHSGGDGENDALVALPDLPDLPELRAAVAGALHDSGVPARREHGFIPHMTLAYLGAGQPRPVENVPPVPLRFDVLSWVVGEDRTDIPLTGAAPVHARTAAIGGPLPILRSPQSEARRRLRKLSRRLAAIERKLTGQAQAGAQVAVAEALRRAGVKVAMKARNKGGKAAAVLAANDYRTSAAVLAAVGVTEAEALDRAFETYGDSLEGWATDAGMERLGAIAEAYGLEPARLVQQFGARVKGDAAAARRLAVSALGAWATAKLQGVDIFSPEGEQPVDDSLPRSLLVGALALAVGRLVEEGSVGFGDLAEGAIRILPGGGLIADVMGEVEPTAVETVTWQWGGSAVPFPPHLDLNGVSSTWPNYEETFANDADWPESRYYHPADHTGCACSLLSSWDVPESA